jgi:hypothetical protein
VVNFLLFMREAPAEMVGGHCGRNPALLMPKMESTSYIPGGPNLMCCCAHLPNFRGRPGFEGRCGRNRLTLNASRGFQFTD